MHTELKDKYDVSEEPLPPTPHFDSASVAAAKPVQPLSRSRHLQYSRALVRLATAVFAGLIVMALGIATMAHLNNQVNKQVNVAPATPEISETADATDESPAIETEATPLASRDGASVGTDRRRHRTRHHFRVPREMFEPEMFEFDQPSAYGRPRARLVTVIQ